MSHYDPPPYDLSAIAPSAIAAFAAVLVAQFGAWSPAALAIAMALAFVGLTISVRIRERFPRRPPRSAWLTRGGAPFGDRPPVDGTARRVHDDVLEARGR